MSSPGAGAAPAYIHGTRVRFLERFTAKLGEKIKGGTIGLIEAWTKSGVSDDEYLYTVYIKGRGKVYGIPDEILIQVSIDEPEVLIDSEPEEDT